MKKYKITRATYITADGRRRTEALNIETADIEKSRKDLKQSEDCEKVYLQYEEIF